MKSGLAQFLELGAASSAGASGSRALSEDHSDLFLQSLEAVARNIAATFNKQAIKELVDLNFDSVQAYPKLDFEGITETDAKKLSDAFKTLVDTGAVTPQDAD
jgi:phage gp29-like protein